MEQELWNIPNAWEWFSLEIIADINPSLPVDLEKETIVSFIPMKRVEEETGRIDLSETKKYKQVRSGYTKFINEDIIFAKITPCMENGKIAIPKELVNGVGFGSTEFHVIRMKDEQLFNQFYYYFLLQKWFRNLAVQHFTGTVGHRRVPTEFMKEVMVPVPPFNEQVRIVGRVEELFSQLDAAVRSLQTAQTQLEQYRQTTLKQAYTGKLTQKWRKRNGIKFSKEDSDFLKILKSNRLEMKYKQKTYDDFPENLQFPTDWKAVRLDEVAMIADVDHKMPKAKENGIPFISPKDFVDPDSINLKEVKLISEKEYNRLSRKITPNQDDILFSRIGTVGKVRYPPNLEKFHISYSLCIIRTLEEIRAYLYWILKSPSILQQAVQGQQSVGVPDLGLGKIRNFIVPFPPKKEQHKIIEMVEQSFTIYKKMDEEITNTLLMAKNLKNSILKQAFQGRLVPQDPRDEPASVLLERIKAQKTKQRKLK